MLKTLQNVEYRRQDGDEECPAFHKLIFNVVPASGDEENYDFDVSLNADKNGWLGFEGQDLIVNVAIL